MMWSEKYRPQDLTDLIGNEDARKFFVEWFGKWKIGTKPLLLVGPPGIGKTTLANIIANELGVNIKTTSGPVLDKPGDLAGLLTNLEERDVLFIDPRAVVDAKCNSLVPLQLPLQDLNLFMKGFLPSQILVGQTVVARCPLVHRQFVPLLFRLIGKATGFHPLSGSILLFLADGRTIRLGLI